MSTLHSYSHHGDPYINSLLTRILAKVSTVSIPFPREHYFCLSPFPSLILALFYLVPPNPSKVISSSSLPLSPGLPAAECYLELVDIRRRISGSFLRVHCVM